MIRSMRTRSHHHGARGDHVELQYTGKVDAGAKRQHERSRGRPGGVAACVGFDQNWASRDRASSYQRHARRVKSCVGTVGTFRTLQGDPERARSLYRAALLHCEDQPLVRAEILRKWGMMEMASSDQSRSAAHEDLFFDPSTCSSKRVPAVGAAAQAIDGAGEDVPGLGARSRSYGRN